MGVTKAQYEVMCSMLLSPPQIYWLPLYSYTAFCTVCSPSLSKKKPSRERSEGNNAEHTKMAMFSLFKVLVDTIQSFQISHPTLCEFVRLTIGDYQYDGALLHDARSSGLGREL